MLTNEDIAAVCHEVNRAYCQALGDDSQAPWAEAPDWQRASALAGVALHLADPEAGPEASHASWMAEKAADGWTWGPQKDPIKKEHPCMVAFADLPYEQQAKDHIFRAVVHALAPHLVRTVPLGAPGSRIDDAVEAYLAGAGTAAPRVVPDALRARVAQVEIVRHRSAAGQVLRWAVLTMVNGFAVAGRPSYAVSPENDEERLGTLLAVQNAFDEVWRLEGYLLKERLHESGQLANACGVPR